MKWHVFFQVIGDQFTFAATTSVVAYFCCRTSVVAPLAGVLQILQELGYFVEQTEQHFKKE